MITLAIANHKGGVGKTATTLHLGGALAHLGHTVLLWDLDPMGGLTTLLRQCDGPNPFTDGPVLRPTSMERVSLVPGGPALKSAEAWLAHRPHTALRALLEALAPAAEFVLIDCPPQLDDFTKNALVAADAAVHPVSCDTQDLLSFHKLLLTAGELESTYAIAPARVALLTKYHGESYDEEFRETLAELAPLVFERPIRYSTCFRQAGLYGASVFTYEPEDSPAREDYLAVARDVLGLVGHGEALPHPLPPLPPSEGSVKEGCTVWPVSTSCTTGPSPSGRGAGECLKGRGPGPGGGRGEGELPSEAEAKYVRSSPNPKSKIQNPKSKGGFDVAA